MEEKLHRIERELQLMSSDKEMLQSVLKHFFTTKDKRQAVNFYKILIKLAHAAVAVCWTSAAVFTTIPTVVKTDRGIGDGKFR